MNLESPASGSGQQALPRDEVVYPVVSSRRQGYDQMMWQVPALSLTAQAFLFSIALASSASQATRLIAATLALFTSLMSIQLMGKHRHHELQDALLLEKMEQDLGMRPVHTRKPPMGRSPSTGPNSSPGAGPARTPWLWLIGLSSYRVWVLGLGVFGLAAAVVLVLSAFSPATFA